MIFMYIEHNTNDVPYLTLCWNKHRDEPPPPKEDKFCAYRFMGPVLGIMDDINLDKDYSVSDIYSDNSEPVPIASSFFGKVDESTTEVAPPERPEQEEPAEVEATQDETPEDIYV